MFMFFLFPKSPTLTVLHQCLWCCFRFDADCAAGPRPQIQDQHQGPLSGVSPVSFRGSYWHRQRDAASLQVGSGNFYTIFFNFKETKERFCCKTPYRLHWKSSRRVQLKLHYFSASTEQSDCQWGFWRSVTMTQMCHVLQSLCERQQPPPSHRCLRGVPPLLLWCAYRWWLICFPHASPASVQQWRVMQTSDCTAAAAGLEITSFALIIRNKLVSRRHLAP